MGIDPDTRGDDLSYSRIGHIPRPPQAQTHRDSWGWNRSTIGGSKKPIWNDSAKRRERRLPLLPKARCEAAQYFEKMLKGISRVIRISMRRQPTIADCRAKVTCNVKPGVISTWHDFDQEDPVVNPVWA